MKFLSIVFSVYILLVSTMVCCPDDFVVGNIYHTENQVDGDAHGDCAGLCSPFCVCNACPGFSVEITPRLVITALSQGSTVPSFSDFSYIPKRSIPAIWQPPKD